MYYRSLTQMAGAKSSKTFVRKVTQYSGYSKGKVVFQIFSKLPNMQAGELVPFT